jgi:error-prone DNA polymerase
MIPSELAPSGAPVVPFAQLQSYSAFSFGMGASQPEELVTRAHQLGYRALALTDDGSVAGVVRAHVQARLLGLQLIPGASFSVACGASGSALAFTAVVLPHNLQGWGNLCQCITHARRAAPKGQYRLAWDDPVWATLQDCEVLLSFPFAINFEALCAILTRAKDTFFNNLWLSAHQLLRQDDALHRARQAQLVAFSGVPEVAASPVLMHVRSRKPLQDVLNAVHQGRPVARSGFALEPNAEAHLRSIARLQMLHSQQQLANTLVVAARCSFSLDQLRYHYPLEAVLPGLSPTQTLRRYTEEGALERYPQGMLATVRKQVEHELELIAQLRYEMYFLTVHDIVRFARGRGILCQGRGSAANSAVCYCLGVTEVDPSRMNVLFERFISRERDEPPDIDIDFEHQRREEVIQYFVD